MYLMYVDESGDTGLAPGGSSHFALTGLVVHESRWRDLVDVLMKFRRTMRAAHNLPVRMEIHASQYLRHPPVPNMLPHVRIAILCGFRGKSATHSGLKPAADSDLKSATRSDGSRPPIPI